MRRILAVVVMMACLAACSTPYDTYKVGMDKTDKTAIKEKESLTYEYEGNTVRCMTDEFMLEASYLSPERVDLYFSMFKGGVFKNPFDSGTFIIFSMTVENRSQKALSYNPRMTLLYLDKSTPAQPKDFASLYALFEISQTEDIEKKMETCKAVCFDTTVTVGPGQRVQRLIVYPRGEKTKAKSAALIVNNLYMDYKSHTVPLTFSDIAN